MTLLNELFLLFYIIKFQLCNPISVSDWRWIVEHLFWALYWIFIISIICTSIKFEAFETKFSSPLKNFCWKLFIWYFQCFLKPQGIGVSKRSEASFLIVPSFCIFLNVLLFCLYHYLMLFEPKSSLIFLWYHYTITGC